jgi:hypothetical protein
MSYTAGISAFGFDLSLVNINELPLDIELVKIGDILNERTNKRCDENTLKIEISVKFEDGFSNAVDQLLNRINDNDILSTIFNNSEYIELQIWIKSYGGELLVPSIHFTKEQISKLSILSANIDISID